MLGMEDAMLTYHLTGRVGKDGKLQLRLPEGIPPGEVEVVITVSDAAESDDTPWTDEEIRQMMQVEPKTGAEIAALLGGMEPGFQHIADSVAWVEEQRRKQRESLQW
jgi:hypothetical protein